MTTDAQAPSNAIPRMVGRYHILEEVGRSTFGPLHLARFEGPGGFQRWSSVLEVEARFAGDPEFRHAFYESARMSARIQHPNVVATLDVGETEGTLWLASEYLLGEMTKDLLVAAQQSKVPVPWDIACRIVADAALGLDAIHELSHPTSGAPMKLVHGRLAPHRVVVTYDGATKVMEPSSPFVGLLSGDAGQAKTMVGRALAYTAPELLRGEAFDRRADIFSLGVILWELSAGRRLFGGRDESESRAKIHANAVPPLSESVRGFPPEVEAIIRQALAHDPQQRIPTAKALARGLHQALVKDALVVTDDEVSRYLLQLFPDRLTKKKNRLLTAADVTQVFQRDHQMFMVGPSSQGPRALDDDDATRPTPLAATRPMTRAARNAQGAAYLAAQPSPHAATIPPQALTYRAPASAPEGAAAGGGVERSASPASDTDVTLVPGRKTREILGPSVLLFLVLGVAAAVIALLVVVVVRRSPADAVEDEPISPSATAPLPPQATAPAAPSGAPPPPSASPVPTAHASASAPAASHQARPPRAPSPANPPPPVASPVAKGRLTIICDPACDDVLDGRASLGPSPIYKRSVAVGPHHITLRVAEPPTMKTVDVVVSADDVAVVKETMAK